MCVVVPSRFVLRYLAGLIPASLPRKGLLKLAQMVLKTRPDGLVHSGPPCSTFVWVNRHTSKRSKEFPEGDSSVQSVSASNAILGLRLVYTGSSLYDVIF